MKLPKLKYVRFVPSKGVTYAYFNTGRKVAGNLVYTSLPPFGTTGFYDSYAAMLGGRGKRAGGVHRVSDLVDAYQRSLDFSRLS